MASTALKELHVALEEIEAIQRANPSPAEGGGLTRPTVARALGRAEVVLLSSHFERYIYALNEEIVRLIVDQAVDVSRLPDEFRLLHSKQPIEGLAEQSWERRSEGLQAFSAQEAILWTPGAIAAEIDADRILAWMKAPSCKALRRYFRIWGIDDIFSAVTRSKTKRQALWLRIGELVDKRNSIAHGDLTVEARYLDIVQYRAAVKKFSDSADKKIATVLARTLGCERPW